MKTVGVHELKERLSLAVERGVMTQTLFGRRRIRKERQKEKKKISSCQRLWQQNGNNGRVTCGG